MSIERNLNLANIFLAKLGSAASPDEVTMLFAEDLTWNVPGDAGALPWLGKKIGRTAASDFIRTAGLCLSWKTSKSGIFSPMTNGLSLSAN